jgi:hypothetical protein
MSIDFTTFNYDAAVTAGIAAASANPTDIIIVGDSLKKKLQILENQ